MRNLKTTARLLLLALLLSVGSLADDSQRIEALAGKAYPHLKVTEVRQRSAWAVVEFEHKEPEPGDEHVMQMLWRKDSGAWFPIDLHRRGYELRWNMSQGTRCSRHSSTNLPSCTCASGASV